MQKTIDETNRRRTKQIEYNTRHGITPKTVSKSREQVFAQTSVLDIKGFDPKDTRAGETLDTQISKVAEEQPAYRSIPEIEKALKQTRKSMEKAARDLDFMEAARLRDEMFRLQKELEEIKT